jgi:hypothetical protein
MRVGGLVRIANGVRREIAAGVSPARKQTLRAMVSRAIVDTEELMRGHGGVRALPPPSQRAYAFLKGIDWDKVPAGEGTANPKLYNWPGLNARLDDWLERLAAFRQDDDDDDGELEAIGKSIELQHRRIETDVGRLKIPPEAISAATRRVRGWVAYFALRENLRQYVDALARARRILQAPGTSKWKGPVSIHFRPAGVIYRVIPSSTRTTIWFPTPMIVFDDSLFAALGEMIVSRGPARRSEVIEAMQSEPYERLRTELEVLGGVAEQTRGMTHDLQASFDRVNAEYFNGRMPRPRLTWNRVFTGRKFGHYDFLRDTVMLSSTLDQPKVPQFVLDYVMYHELLHKEMGVDVVNGRRYAHTREFYDAERRFPRLAEADAILNDLARHP